MPVASSRTSDPAAVSAAAVDSSELIGHPQVEVVVGAEVGVDDVGVGADGVGRALGDDAALGHHDHPVADVVDDVHVVLDEQHARSEEHTSELQSHSELVCRLLLEKKKYNLTIPYPASKKNHLH